MSVKEKGEKKRGDEKSKIPGDGHLFSRNIHKNHRLPKIYMTTGNIKKYAAEMMKTPRE